MKTTRNVSAEVGPSKQRADIGPRRPKIVGSVSTLLVAFLLAIVPVSVCQVTIDPKASYVLTYDDPGAVSVLPISLTSLGINPGDTIQIQTQGDFSFCFPYGCPQIQVPAVVCSARIQRFCQPAAQIGW